MFLDGILRRCFPSPGCARWLCRFGLLWAAAAPLGLWCGFLLRHIFHVNVLLAVILLYRRCRLLSPTHARLWLRVGRLFLQSTSVILFQCLIDGGSEAPVVATRRSLFGSGFGDLVRRWTAACSLGGHFRCRRGLLGRLLCCRRFDDGECVPVETVLRVRVDELQQIRPGNFGLGHRAGVDADQLRCRRKKSKGRISSDPRARVVTRFLARVSQAQGCGVGRVEEG